jgi:hypothetical protein
MTEQTGELPSQPISREEFDEMRIATQVALETARKAQRAATQQPSAETSETERQPSPAFLRTKAAVQSEGMAEQDNRARATRRKPMIMLQGAMTHDMEQGSETSEYGLTRSVIIAITLLVAVFFILDFANRVVNHEGLPADMADLMKWAVTSIAGLVSAYALGRSLRKGLGKPAPDAET